MLDAYAKESARRTRSPAMACGHGSCIHVLRGEAHRGTRTGDGCELRKPAHGSSMLKGAACALCTSIAAPSSQDALTHARRAMNSMAPHCKSTTLQSGVLRTESLGT